MQTFENSGFRSQFLNLGRVLCQTSLKNPNGIAVVCGEEQLSLEGLDQSTDALARWLLQAGLESGDRVAIHWCRMHQNKA
jgi:long-chain acyl-CoA synthetase